jgi:hypothetical protein
MFWQISTLKSKTVVEQYPFSATACVADFSHADLNIFPNMNSVTVLSCFVFPENKRNYIRFYDITKNVWSVYFVEFWSL